MVGGDTNHGGKVSPRMVGGDTNHGGKVSPRMVGGDTNHGGKIKDTFHEVSLMDTSLGIYPLCVPSILVSDWFFSVGDCFFTRRLEGHKLSRRIFSALILF